MQNLDKQKQQLLAFFEDAIILMAVRSDISNWILENYSVTLPAAFDQ